MAQPVAKGVLNIVTGKYPAKDKNTGQPKLDQYGNQIMNDQTLPYGEWTDWGDVISIEVPDGSGGVSTLKIFKPKDNSMAPQASAQQQPQAAPLQQYAQPQQQPNQSYTQK